MFKDDRVMSILTGLVIVVAMATLAQKSDTLLDYFFADKGAGVAPQNDAVAVVAGKSQIIDVLANDEGVTPEDAANVRILVSPSCGAAEATANGVLYIPNDRCVGDQLFAYCVQRGDECSSASVTVSVLSSEPQRLVVGAQPSQESEAVAQPPAELISTGDQSDRIVTGARPGLAPLERIAAPEEANDAIQAPRLTLAPLREDGPEVEQAVQLRADGGVAAAVRPVKPSNTDIGRLALAPAGDIGADDGGFMDLLRDDSEPHIGQGNAPRLINPVAASDAVSGGAGESSAPVRIAALSPQDAEAEVDDRSAPDVSAIEALQPVEKPEAEAVEGDEAVEVDVASIEDADNRDTRLELQAEAIGDLNENTDAVVAEPVSREPSGEAAALVTPEDATPPVSETLAPVEDAKVQGCGPIDVTSFAAQGATSRIVASSLCRAGQVALFRHAGFEFATRFDRTGKAGLTLPILDDRQGVEIITADGARQKAELEYDEIALDLALRIAVGWTTPVDLDLHVFEYSAGFGDEGHIWQQNPRQFRDVRRNGGGYLSSFQAQTAGGQSIEVYTFWANSRARKGYVRIALDHASRGDEPSGAFCGGGRVGLA